MDKQKRYGHLSPEERAVLQIEVERKTSLRKIAAMLRRSHSTLSINADIQSAIARARGFRTFENLRTVVYLLNGKLKLPSSPFQTPVARP